MADQDYQRLAAACACAPAPNKTRTCARCAAEFRPKMPKQTLCSRVCRVAVRVDSKRVNPPKDFRDCAWCCGRFMQPVPGAMYCSKPCKLSAWKRENPGRMRALRLRDVTRRRVAQESPGSELVDPFRVFDRDSWRCRRCGVDTPKAKRGTYDDDAPELDHIHPLSKGGAHSYANTQCLCRRCNGAKAARLEPLATPS
jgi:5-methylcytosine-specific restriction endonuclease McrA